jgi:glucosamine--fructose-6-phosphate aminotransferase (isomerizing)
VCGIVGIIGHDNSLRIAVDALKRLEYRGYDSFGVSVLHEKSISTKKAIGSVIEHDQGGFFDSVVGSTCTIAHTRWATHGGVTEANAHPHVSFDGQFALVHNGVIENYRELRQYLLDKGIKCISETDTEIIVHLIADHFLKTKDIREALRLTLLELTGEYAIVFEAVNDPAHLYAARFKSPLGFGIAAGLGVVASDQRAIGPLTPDMTFLEDHDVLVLSSDEACIYQLANDGTLSETSRKPITLPWAGDDDGLDGYRHYMAKEIHESPVAAENALRINENIFSPIVEDISSKDLSITGIGSSFYVAQVAQYYFSQLADTYARVHPSDEILSLVSLSGKDHLIAVSQSGETFDTLETIRTALRAGSTVTSINNVRGSSCQRLATFPIFQGAGTEICVLSTKSIVSQTLILYRLAKLLGLRKGTLTQSEFDRLSRDEARFPDTIKYLFDTKEEKIRETAGWNRHIDNWFFIGRGIHYPVAMESALKFKEVSYRHAEGMPAGFFKHGTISLIDDNFFTVAFLPQRSSLEGEAYKFTISNISEIQARGGPVIGIGHDDDISPDVGGLYDYISIPTINPYLDPILELISGQLLSYYCAYFLNRNIDKPRSLAKSVTVR